MSSGFKFNPRKKVEGDHLTPNNGKRARNGEKMLRCLPDVGQKSLKKMDPGDVICHCGDALADFFHFCDREGVDVDEVIEKGKMHWEAER